MFDLPPYPGSMANPATTWQTRLGIYPLLTAAGALRHQPDTSNVPDSLANHTHPPSIPMTQSFPILLVDDDPDIAEVIRRAASRDFPEARFEHVQRPEDVLPFLEDPARSIPRLILLDIDLKSGQTGLDLIPLLRTHPRGHLVPIVVLSVSQDKQAIVASYELGASSFIHKPYTYADWQYYVQALRTYWFDTVTTLKNW